MVKRVITFYSLCTVHSQWHSCDCVDRLLEYPFFADITEFQLWSDNGSHFRSNHFISHLLLNHSKKRISYNTFQGKHGRGDVDQFFGMERRGLNQQARVTHMNNINDVLHSMVHYFLREPVNEYFFEEFVLFYLHIPF